MPLAPDKEQTGIFCEGREEVIWEIYGYYQPEENKWYIGSTNQGVSRRAGKDGEGYRQCRKFWAAIKKYGWENFDRCIFRQTSSKEEALKLEDYYMEVYDSVRNGYNSKYNYEPAGVHTSYVLQYDKSFNLIKKYKSLSQASKRSGVPEYKIVKAILDNESVHSFYWRILA